MKKALISKTQKSVLVLNFTGFEYTSECILFAVGN